MRVLLATHSFLWFIAGSDDLSIRARDLIADLGNEVLLSAASLWEIAIKVSIGKLELSRPFGEIIPEQLRENEITIPDGAGLRPVGDRKPFRFSGGRNAPTFPLSILKKLLTKLF